MGAGCYWQTSTKVFSSPGVMNLASRAASHEHSRVKAIRMIYDHSLLGLLMMKLLFPVPRGVKNSPPFKQGWLKKAALKQVPRSEVIPASHPTTLQPLQKGVPTSHSKQLGILISSPKAHSSVLSCSYQDGLLDLKGPLTYPYFGTSREC